MKAKRSAKKAKKGASSARAGAKRRAAKATKGTRATKLTKAAKSTKPAKAKKRASDSGKAVLLPHLRERWPRTAAERKARAAEYYERLAATYPDAHCALDHEDAYQLLVATILSAQCTDKRVNIVTPELFKRYPSATQMAGAEREELETEIKSTGFFRSKTKSLLGMAQSLVARHGGAVPDSMDELTQLPGVGRKTANVVLGNAFHKNVGIVVDTHVTRLSERLGLTRETDAVKIEEDLMPLFPSDQWTMVSHLLIEHGRQICLARAPRCEECPLNDICPSSRV
jgi:endonuclease-3